MHQQLLVADGVISSAGRRPSSRRFGVVDIYHIPPSLSVFTLLCLLHCLPTLYFHLPFITYIIVVEHPSPLLIQMIL